MFGNNNAFSSFAVDDIAKAKEFYGQTLGIKTTEEPMGILLLHFSNGQQIVIYPKSDYQPAVFTLLNFPVDDIDKAVDDLIARGISIVTYDDFEHDEKGIMRGDEGPFIAWFEDPAGNILSVLQDR